MNMDNVWLVLEILIAFAVAMSLISLTVIFWPHSGVAFWEDVSQRAGVISLIWVIIKVVRG